MKSLKLYLVIVCAIFMSACSAAHGPAFSEGPQLGQGQTGIYIYRLHYTMKARGISIAILLDGKNIGELEDNGYLFAPVSAGTHTLRVSDKGLFNDYGGSITFTLKPGEVLYFKAELIMDSFYFMPFPGGAKPVFSGGMKPLIVSKSTAMQDLKSLHYSN